MGSTLKLKFACSVLLLSLFGCSYRPLSKEWRSEYRYLRFKPTAKVISFEEPLLILSVDAPHLDTSSPFAFFRTLAKHPSTGSTERDFGHAWITLFYQGEVISCGHSGEADPKLPGYFDSVMDLVESCDPNPIRALFEERGDGFLEEGSGGHTPTFSIAKKISVEEAERILLFIRTYPSSRYSLTRYQCVSFVQSIAEIVHLDLPAERKIEIPSEIEINRTRVLLWSDSRFSCFIFLSPDRLERSMIEAARCGAAESVQLLIPITTNKSSF